MVKGIVARIVVDWTWDMVVLFGGGAGGRGREVMVVVAVMVLGSGVGVVPGRVMVVVVVVVSVAIGAMAGGVRVFVGEKVSDRGKKGAKEVGVGVVGAVAVMGLEGRLGVGMLAGWS